MSIFDNLFGSDESEEETYLDDDEESFEDVSEDAVQDYSTINRDLITPEVTIRDKNMYKIDNKFTRTYFVKKWPTEPNQYFIENILSDMQSENTVSIYIDPFNEEDALRYLKKESKRARNILEGETSGFLTTKQREKTLQETISLYEALNNSDTNLFKVSMYVTIKADSEEELNRQCRDMRSLFKKRAGIYLAEAFEEHEPAFQSNTPTMNDRLSSYNHEMPGGAIGYMNPFTTTTIMEDEDGIDYGFHEKSGTPVFIDRFNRDTGYNEIVAGTIGSGKSFSSSLTILRTKAKYGDDIRIFILDPVDGFGPETTAMKGTEINPLNTELNPFEIEKEENPDNIDYNPLALQQKKVMDFFNMFYNMTGDSLEKKKEGVLSNAVRITYKDKAGITEEIETHSKESPTINDLFEVLGEMIETPEKYMNTSDKEVISQTKKIVGELQNELRPFTQGGQFENLAAKTDENFRDNDVYWVNLDLVEGTGKKGLLMYAYISSIYESSKKSDKKTLIYIDEAHYMMENSETLSFLTQMVRHSRHNKIGITFITQEIDDFFEHKDAKTIASQCSIKRFQKIDGGIPKDIAELLDLNEQEQKYIRDAQAGGDHGYSTALLQVDDDFGQLTIPLLITASETEKQIIDWGDNEQVEEQQKEKEQLKDFKQEIERIDSEQSSASDTEETEDLAEHME